MNDIPYSEIREETEVSNVRLHIANGWMLVEIYRRKREVRYSNPTEFEEYPVYILGNTQGG